MHLEASEDDGSDDEAASHEPMNLLPKIETVGMLPKIEPSGQLLKVRCVDVCRICRGSCVSCTFMYIYMHIYIRYVNTCVYKCVYIYIQMYLYIVYI